MAQRLKSSRPGMSSENLVKGIERIAKLLLVLRCHVSTNHVVQACFEFLKRNDAIFVGVELLQENVVLRAIDVESIEQQRNVSLIERAAFVLIGFVEVLTKCCVLFFVLIKSKKMEIAFSYHFGVRCVKM